MHLISFYSKFLGERRFSGLILYSRFHYLYPYGAEICKSVVCIYLQVLGVRGGHWITLFPFFKIFFLIPKLEF